MSQSDNLFDAYDEEHSIAFIQNYLPLEMKGKFSDDDLNYIVDLIYEFYEDKGYLEEETDDKEVEIDEEELVSFVIKQAKKNQVGKFTPDEISFVVQGELAYCDSINLFD